MLIGASWPWNLSTVPTRACGGRRLAIWPTWALYGRDHEHILVGDRVRIAVAVDPRRAALGERANDAGHQERLRPREAVGTDMVRLDEADPASARAAPDRWLAG